MIRPKIPLVQSGQRLSVELMNGMINRTEYAADLLKQYKMVAGNEMYVEPHYDGTRVSYFYSVGGGSTPKGAEVTRPPSVSVVFSCIGADGGLYASPSFSKTDQFIYSDFGLPSPTIPALYGIRGKFALGVGRISGINFGGIIYNGIFNGLIGGSETAPSLPGQGFYTQYPGSEWTEFWDIDPLNFNIIVGSYYSPPNYIYQGLIYNLSFGNYETFNRPNQNALGTYLTGIYDGVIIGGQAFGSENSFYYDGSFNFLPSGFFPYGIYEKTIVGTNGLIYEIGSGFVKTISIPSLGAIDLTGKYKNFVCGQKASSPFTSFIYNLNDDSYSIINDRIWAIG